MELTIQQKISVLLRDLRLCWFVGTLEVITPEEGDKIKEELVDQVNSGKSYEEALKEGHLKIFELLKEKSEY